jgi:peptidoglycan/xylan/chitin deacetylase (PgdA/CDA1 family)
MISSMLFVVSLACSGSPTGAPVGGSGGGGSGGSGSGGKIGSSGASGSAGFTSAGGIGAGGSSAQTSGGSGTGGLSGTGGSNVGAGGSSVSTGGRLSTGGVSASGGVSGSGDRGTGGVASGGSSSTGNPGAGGSNATGGNGAGGSGNGGVASGGSSGGAGAVPACPSSGFAWPNGAEAAVSMTYDDALASQLDNAMPVLDRLGLKMTFFLVTNSLESATLRARYTAALAVGHELASHSVSHPCSDKTPNYTLDTIVSAELDPSIATLKSMGATSPFTYAYPCGTTTVGSNQSYIPQVNARFIAARGVWGIVADPKTVDLGNTPGIFPSDTDTNGAQAIADITKARTQGGWVVFGFHGVGGDYLITPQTTHDAIAQYLADNKVKVWTATFRDVAAYIARCR